MDIHAAFAWLVDNWLAVIICAGIGLVAIALI